MLGWRKKRDGFEWHDYVRTTILLRRAKRRQKVDDARAAAVHGLKDAGSAAAHGLNEAKGAAADGLRRAGEMGQAIGASGVSSAAILMQRLWTSTRQLLARVRTTGATSARALAARLTQLASTAIAPLLARLSDRRTRTIVGAVGVAALFAVAYRIWAVGFDTRAVFAALLALLTLGPALAAERKRDDATRRPASQQLNAAEAIQAPVSMKLLRPVVVWGSFAALVVLGIGTLINPDAVRQLPSSAAVSLATPTPTPSRPADPVDNVRGRARAISGDTLRIGRTLVRLNHIEAPDPGQTCKRPDGRDWRCGDAARSALSRLVAGTRIACTLTGSNSGEIAHGDCKKDDMDLAASLVRDGHVFAETGFFARHSSLEGEARENHRGIWNGDAQRPESFRAAAWQAATEKAPDACPIKGRVASREKRYVMPWMEGYANITIRASRGERWFCSEEDARKAGWRPTRAL